jgi:hypothetical protein
MPNLWTSTTQKIYEVFYGARTIDTEFNNKHEELKACEKSLGGIRHILANFQKNTLGLKNFLKDVYTHMSLAYSDNSPYWSSILEVCSVHQEAERLLDGMVEFVGILCNQTLDWERNFDDAKKNIAMREEFRRTYDHYDEKLEKLVKSRQDKATRGVRESDKEIQQFERVKIKFLIYFNNLNFNLNFNICYKI